MVLILAGCSRTKVVTMEQDMNYYSYLMFDVVKNGEPVPYYANPSDPMFGHCVGVLKEFETFYVIEGPTCYYRIQKSVVSEFPELLECRVGNQCAFITEYAGVFRHK